MFSSGSLQSAQTSTAWIGYLLLAVLLLVLVFWWLNRGKRESLIAPLEATRPSQEQRADDLKRIEGIGRKVAQVLNQAGITTFADLAGADPDQVQQTLNAAGLQMMNPEGWIEQAELAARGDWDGLAKLQAELKGGRKT